MRPNINFDTNPSIYKHWQLIVENTKAFLIMKVDEDAGFFDGYKLKLNSYDIGVDIELADAVQRLRFEYPNVNSVIIKSGNEKAFCAGANIKMLASSDHAHKVNFCKFTNETRNFLENSSKESNQLFICLVEGVCAGGGYELALACDHIILMDDGSSSISLPEVPLLAVLPGTGGLTRLTDKRKIRRDLADVFCTMEEGVKAKKAFEWRLVDTILKKTTLNDDLQALIEEKSIKKPNMDNLTGIKLNNIKKNIINENEIKYSTISVNIDRDKKSVTITIQAPVDKAPINIEDILSQGDDVWLLRCARELDDAILYLRFNELEIGIIFFKTRGEIGKVLSYDKLFETFENHWFIKEISYYWSRVFKRIDLTSRTLTTLIEAGSCYAGFLCELIFSADRSYMAEGKFEELNNKEASIVLSNSNFGRFLMSNDMSRLNTRFIGLPNQLLLTKQNQSKYILAKEAYELGLITFIFDDIDWDDEIRLFLEERSSFSPDSMVGMEANLRFPGKETMETKIFGRLTAWQNWIFQRPSAVGEEGALKKYGTGNKGMYTKERT
ncbi:2,3-epoxybenzoyl-CoA dihydrolase [Alphaproteobacteria bacterium]|uniref:2,3-epoxybenzoyl-CoA dihydrolase n=1 Tax=Candidatus Levibacter sp. Uisw_134_01 TaxID=3230999 RepID=UPI0023250023|nr:2,3-epoxybenzoyl-CoA dihydrolase [Alphaproteobacteria bacterium]